MNLSSITQVTNDKLRDSAALSVIGRSANSTGDPADIAAAIDGHVLCRSGTTLGFGQIVTDGIDDLAVTNSKLATATQQSLVPTGAVMAFAKNSVPSGWIAANGAEYSKTAYANLFGAIGIVFGETNGAGGNGTSHFRVPDLRGIFVRGSGSQTIVTGTESVTYNKAFGQKEKHALENIIGKIDLHSQAGFNVTLSGAFYSSDGSCASTLVRFGDGCAEGDYTFDASRVVKTSTETRPAYLALLYCIKF